MTDQTIKRRELLDLARQAGFSWVGDASKELRTQSYDGEVELANLARLVSECVVKNLRQQLVAELAGDLNPDEVFLQHRAATFPAQGLSTQPVELNSLGLAKHWSVTVEVEGDQVLCISHQHVAGCSDLDPYHATIQNCAEHLLAFIGASSAQKDRDAVLEDAAKACDDERQRLDGIIARCKAMQDKDHEREYTATRKCCHYLSVVIRDMKNVKTTVTKAGDAAGLATWPERIWLQHGDDGDATAPYPGPGREVTWCEDNINTNDIKYMRADLAPVAAECSTDCKELATLKRVAACGTVDSFLALSDDNKRVWFALGIEESARRKSAEQRVEALEAELDTLKGTSE